MSHQYPSPARAWYLVALLTVAYVFSFVDKYLPAILIEPIKQDLGASDTQMGLLLGPAFALLYATLGLPLGWLADRTRRTTLVATGVALWSLATAVSGLARNFGHLLLARLDAVAWLTAGVTTLKWTSLALAHRVMLYALSAAGRSAAASRW